MGLHLHQQWKGALVQCCGSEGVWPSTARTNAAKLSPQSSPQPCRANSAWAAPSTEACRSPQPSDPLWGAGSHLSALLHPLSLWCHLGEGLRPLHHFEDSCWPPWTGCLCFSEFTEPGPTFYSHVHTVPNTGQSSFGSRLLEAASQ